MQALTRSVWNLLGFLRSAPVSKAGQQGGGWGLLGVPAALPAFYLSGHIEACILLQK